MLKILLSMSMIFISLIMFFFNNPLSLGLMILIQTLLMCLLSGMFINTYWFSYILFLTFLGGLLVLFIYVSSIASNEMFKFSMMNLNFMITIFLLMMAMMMMFYNNLTWLNFYFNLEMNNLFENYLFFNNENKINLSKLYDKQTFMLTMMLIIYLFITLVATVKITNIIKGPLRTFN